MANVVLVLIGLVVIAAFSVLEARAQEALWSKCRRSESLRQVQQQISVGKSRIR